jgi:glc operon protein GlcG
VNKKELAMSDALTLTQAQKLQALALEQAIHSGHSIALAVVDAGGHLLSFARMPDVGAAAVDIVIGKARTAAHFKMPTNMLAEIAVQTPAILTTGAVALDGGVPINVGKTTIGALAVGGLSPEADHALAQSIVAGFRD